MGNYNHYDVDYSTLVIHDQDLPNEAPYNLGGLTTSEAHDLLADRV